MRGDHAYADYLKVMRGFENFKAEYTFQGGSRTVECTEIRVGNTVGLKKVGTDDAIDGEWIIMKGKKAVRGIEDFSQLCAVTYYFKAFIKPYLGSYESHQIEIENTVFIGRAVTKYTHRGITPEYVYIVDNEYGKVLHRNFANEHGSWNSFEVTSLEIGGQKVAYMKN